MKVTLLASAAWSVVVLAACDPFHTQFDPLEPAETYRASRLEPTPEPVESLLMMTYNIKFGGGRIDFFFDCFGDRVLMSRGEVLSNLEKLAEKIRQVDPDLLLLQEVDTNSKRSAFVDQVQWLLDHTALNYGAYAATWRADYVPSDGLGPMDSGNAILSRWPLLGAERIALPLIEEQDWLTRYFYIQSNILTARVGLLDQDSFYAVVTHADAYSKDGTKEKHIDRFKEEFDALASGDALVMGGGDLNTLPPSSDKLSGFPDSVCDQEEYLADDYSAETEWLVPLYESYQPAIELDRYQQDNARYFTHTVDKNDFWNRKLDYLFTNGRWAEGSGLVHQDASSGGMATMPLSDHAPVTAVLELP
jgi:endonuclease/exonuclease/phosphatase family metal-dependent hydrolase